VLHEGGAATAAAGGPPRLAFVTGLLRYQAKTRGAREAEVFAWVFVVGVFERALLESPLLGLRGAKRWLGGRREDAAATWRAAAGWLRLLERDAGALLGLLRPGR
jgi:hypothetical protein